MVNARGPRSEPSKPGGEALRALSRRGLNNLLLAGRCIWDESRFGRDGVLSCWRCTGVEHLLCLSGRVLTNYRCGIWCRRFHPVVCNTPRQPTFWMRRSAVSFLHSPIEPPSIRRSMLSPFLQGRAWWASCAARMHILPPSALM